MFPLHQQQARSFSLANIGVFSDNAKKTFFFLPIGIEKGKPMVARFPICLKSEHSHSTMT